MNSKVMCLAIAVILLIASSQAEPNADIIKRGITEWRFRRLLHDDLIDNSEITLVIKPNNLGFKGKMPALKFRLINVICKLFK